MDLDAVCQCQGATGIGPERLRWLGRLHEAVARQVGPALSGVVRCPVEASLAGVDELAYGAFLGRLESPCCFHVLEAMPLEDRFLLDVDLRILYAMIDRMLGGRGDEPPPRRALTDIELPLAGRIVRLFLEELRRAWRNTVDLRLAVKQVESNPRLLRVLPADEMVVGIGFRLAIGGQEGMLRLGIPTRAIERLADRAMADAASGLPCALGSDPAHEPATTASDRLVEVSVTLGSSTIAAGELSLLRVGDIIATELSAETPAVVSVGGEANFSATPGAFQGRKAARLVEPVPPAGDKEAGEGRGARGQV